MNREKRGRRREERERRRREERGRWRGEGRREELRHEWGREREEVGS